MSEQHQLEIVWNGGALLPARDERPSPIYARGDKTFWTETPPKRVGAFRTGPRPDGRFEQFAAMLHEGRPILAAAAMIGLHANTAYKWAANLAGQGARVAYNPGGKGTPRRRTT